MDYTTRLLSQNLDSDSSFREPLFIDADRPHRRIFWQDYVATVKRIAVGVQNMGVADQDGVGLLSYNDIYYYVLGDGVVAAGAVYSGIPTFVRQAELATAIQAAGIKWLFVSVEFLDLALATVESLGLPLSMVIVFDPPGHEDYKGSQHSLSKLISCADESHFRNENKGKDPAQRTAFRVFTSGSTGSVKAAKISHQAQVARLDYVGKVLRLKGRSLQVIGTYHVSGLFTYNQACLGVVTLCVSRRNDAVTIAARIRSLKIQYILITPRIVEELGGLVGSIINLPELLSSLQLVTCAGSACRKDLVQVLQGILPKTTRVLVTYGTTELSPVASHAIGDGWITGQVGMPVPGTDVFVIDPKTFQPAEAGTVGEICARSATCFSGYFQDALATKEAFLPNDPSWFRTGDMGSMDESGAVTILGRFKHIFKVRHEEVSPAEVEYELMRHAGIADAIITSIAARDDEEDRECFAYIVTKTGTELTAQEVVDFVSSRLAVHKAPTGGVIFCKRIPRGTAGKVLHNHLAEVVPLPASAKYLTANKITQVPA